MQNVHDYCGNDQCVSFNAMKYFWSFFNLHTVALKQAHVMKQHTSQDLTAYHKRGKLNICLLKLIHIQYMCEVAERFSPYTNMLRTTAVLWAHVMDGCRWK